MAVLPHYRRRSVQRCSSRSWYRPLVPDLEGGRMSLTENLVTSIAALEATLRRSALGCGCERDRHADRPLPGLYRISAVPDPCNGRGGRRRLFASWGRSGLRPDFGREDAFDPQPKWQQPNRKPVSRLRREFAPQGPRSDIRRSGLDGEPRDRRKKSADGHHCHCRERLLPLCEGHSPLQAVGRVDAR
jgi:hypothetical protein